MVSSSPLTHTVLSKEHDVTPRFIAECLEQGSRLIHISSGGDIISTLFPDLKTDQPFNRFSACLDINSLAGNESESDISQEHDYRYRLLDREGAPEPRKYVAVLIIWC